MRRHVRIPFERLTALPQVCVRHDLPATHQVSKTFYSPRRGIFLLRPWWFFSLIYRRSVRVRLPVCQTCSRQYVAARVT